MKQYITAEQLKEITKEQLLSLFPNLKEKEKEEDLYKEITIGKIMEVLNQYVYWELKYDYHMNFLFTAQTHNSKTNRGINLVKAITSNDEICDGLWEAVKQIPYLLKVE